MTFRWTHSLANPEEFSSYINVPLSPENQIFVAFNSESFFFLSHLCDSAHDPLTAEIKDPHHHLTALHSSCKICRPSFQWLLCRFFVASTARRKTQIFLWCFHPPPRKSILYTFCLPTQRMWSKQIIICTLQLNIVH